MKKQNALFPLLALAMVCGIGLACKSLSSSNSETNTNQKPGKPAAANATGEKNSDNSTAGKIENPGLEKPDFTATAEDLDKEFTKKGVTDKDLEKYENKNIAVSGRVSTIVLEKKGTVQPWVTLYAPGILHGVNCYFDDANVSQMKTLKEDKMAKVQGFMDDFIVPEISPKLRHCVVLEAN